MCGRVTEAPALSWAEYYNVMQFELWTSTIKPSYNVTPTQPLACVRLHEGQRTAFVARWGLIPSWAKDTKIGASCSNARAESVDTKPAFRTAFKKRRCLVVANGFYEWDQLHVTKPKQPYYFTLVDGHPITFAGLWERWSPGGEEIESCSIVTCGPNDVMEQFHDRLPVMLPPDLWDVWLDPDIDPQALKDLLVPYPSNQMQFWPVSKQVNSTRGNDYRFGPECVEPMELK